VNSSFEVNSKAEASLFYSPISLEVVFSETQDLWRYKVLLRKSKGISCACR
jgi:hypothetical protein